MSGPIVALVQNPPQVHPPEMAVFAEAVPSYDPSRAADESARLRRTLEDFGLRVVQPTEVLRSLDRAALVSLAAGAIDAEDEERRLLAHKALSGWTPEDLVELVVRRPRLLLRPDPALAAISPDSSYEAYALAPLFGLAFPRDHYVDLDGFLVIGRLRREDRRREVAVMRAVVERLRECPAEVAIDAPDYLEGGDVVAYGSVAVVSAGFRTTSAAAALLLDPLRRRFDHVVLLQDRFRRPDQFHLDHWLALGPSVALAACDRLDAVEMVGCQTVDTDLEPGGNGSQQRTLRDTLRSLDLRIVPLDPDDLEGFIGNALFLPGSSAVVLPDSTASSMRRTLEGLGFETVTVPFSEHQRQRGGIHCATNFLRLDPRGNP